MAIIDPATDAAREVRDLVSQARQALQDSETGGPDRSLATTKSVYYLATAIDKLVNETLVPAFKPEFGNGEVPHQPSPTELEELYVNITERSEQSIPSGHKKFVISFPDVELSIDEIWPIDGFVPDDPTPEDVIDAMRESEDHALPTTVANKWNLIESLRVRYAGDEDGLMADEWDG